MRLNLTFAILAVSVAGSAHAQEYHPSTSAVSASGRFRLEAESPNPGFEKSKELKSFKYTLIDTTTGKPIWTRLQPAIESRPDGEEAPRRAWVDEDGMTLVRTEKDEMFGLGAIDGKKIFQIILHHQFSNADNAEYVQPCSPSPQWAGGSHSYFFSLNLNGSSHRTFIIRTYWGRRIVVDLASGKVLADGDVGEENIAEAKRSEEVWAHEVISKWAKVAEHTKYPFMDSSDEHNGDKCEELEAAVLFSGLQGLQAEIQAIRRLEECHGGDGVRPSLSGGLWITYDPLRQACQTALRRLGETPKARPGVELHSEDRTEVKANVTLKERIAQVESVKKGLSPREVVEILGNPDFERYDRSHLTWDYDLDAEKPYTLRIAFDSKFEGVESVDRLEPPVWKKASQRDRSGID